MFGKILVANRGEIAVRAFRAAHELGAATVAVYPAEDRNCIHRGKADEAYEIGIPGHPVQAYLDVAELVRVATQSGATAIYPGYGFAAENPELAAACTAAGIVFIGPSAQVLALTGDKKRSVTAAREAGLPVLASSEPSTDIEQLVAAAAQMEYPLFVKAVAGGGGRGMRRVDEAAALTEAIAAASREAAAAFGNATVFLEQAVIDPRHIEVQILADADGDVIHLYERDCSLQRRHQKVVEIAPAPNLDPKLRERICADAVAFARHIGYTCAGTVEFLVDGSGRHFFIEMNPRIQVEHTVTEEVTDVDLVSAQLRIAAGASLAELGLSQESIKIHGAALQCRITTENPADGFRPDTGRLTVYRAPGGSGIRLDGAAALGSLITGHFDSLLVKLTCRGRDFSTAVTRAERALAEFKIRGVHTNIDYLMAVLADPEFRAGTITTSFIDQRPELRTARRSRARGSQLLNYLADVTVHRPHGTLPTAVHPHTTLPALDRQMLAQPPAGSKQRLDELGPDRFSQALRAQRALAVTDTTFRDAHQSLLATRVRTSGLVSVAPYVAAQTPQLLALECWGGATFDVALRFLKEDPWERLARLRAAVPNVCLQMLLRGKNTVGYTPYPTSVTTAFVDEAARTGIDIFRIFDALNDVDAMRPAIDAVRATGGAVAQVAMCYTGDLSDPAQDLYTLDYYLRIAEQIVASGAHMLAIKDMAGLLRPAAARTLVGALRREFDLPIAVHTHDTPGGQLATYWAAWEAGADAVDGAAAPLSGTTSQPALSAIVAAAAHTEFDTGLDLEKVTSLEPYWEALRRMYGAFESGIPAPTGRVYDHEIPGGQLSNLRQQAIALGVGNRFEAVESAYADANRLLGRPVKVTPSSKVVGDLALAFVAQGIDGATFAAHPAAYDIPDSVVRFLGGELGQPAAGWPEPLRSQVLAGRTVEVGEQPLSEADLIQLREPGRLRQTRLSELLFAGPAAEFADHVAEYGDTSRLPAHMFFYGLQQGLEHRVRLRSGVDLLITCEAISEPDAAGMVTVMCTLNGELRPILVRDRSAQVVTAARETAEGNDPRQVGAPFAGVVTVTAQPGDAVVAGGVVATIEAMKMEASITTPVDGIVARVVVGPATEVAAGDLLLQLE